MISIPNPTIKIKTGIRTTPPPIPSNPVKNPVKIPRKSNAVMESFSLFKLLNF